MGKPAARVGDMHVCPMFDGPKPHVGGPVLPPGKANVLIGGMPAATITDRCTCASVPDIIVQGAQTVLINNLMAARMGDATVHGGRIIIGCPTVFIGGPTFTDLPSLQFKPVVEQEMKATVGEASFLEGFIPVWGSARDMINSFQEENWIMGLFFLVMTVVEIVALPADIATFGGSAVLIGLIKNGAKYLFKRLLKKKIIKRTSEELAEKAFKESIRELTKKAVKETAEKVVEEIEKKFAIDELDTLTKKMLGIESDAEHTGKMPVDDTNPPQKSTQHTLDMAILSQHVYGGNPRLPVGYEPVSFEDLLRMGITPSMLLDDSSGFKANVYRNMNARLGEPAYVVAYAGTEASVGDIIADAVQSIGLESTQYNKAMDLAAAMKKATRYQGSFETTGHSLGGGLAAAASAVTGAHGTTFNAAGLHQNTTERWRLDPAERDRNASNVDAYYNSDDPLNLAQNNRGKLIATSAPFIGIPKVIGLYASGALPPAYGNPLEIPSQAGVLNGHQIGTVISNLEQQ